MLSSAVVNPKERKENVLKKGERVLACSGIPEIVGKGASEKRQGVS